MQITDPYIRLPSRGLTLSVEKRQIGGLGIFLTKMTMDSITCAYEQQQNILTIRKTT